MVAERGKNPGGNYEWARVVGEFSEDARDRGREVLPMRVGGNPLVVIWQERITRHHD